MTPDAGRLLYAHIQPVLSRGEVVDIDMTGITAVPSFFLNVTLGQAMQDFGVDFTREHFRFHHISASNMAHFRDYFSKYASLISSD